MSGLFSVFRWGASSLLGHVVLLEATTGVALFVSVLYLLAEQDTLTLGWILSMAFLCAAGTALVAVAVWYTVTRPLLHQREGADHQP